MQTIYKLDENNIYTFDHQSIEDYEGCPKGWTRVDLSQYQQGQIVQVIGDNVTILSQYPNIIDVPDHISMAQARIALIRNNQFDNVDTLVKSLSQEYQVWWEYATTVERNNQMVNAIGTQLSLDLDQLFIEASVIL